MITKLGALCIKYAELEEELNALGIPMRNVTQLLNDPVTKAQVRKKLESVADKDLLNELEAITAQINSAQRGKITSDVARDKSVANGFTEFQHYDAGSKAGALWRWGAKIGDFPDTKHNDPSITIGRYVSPVTDFENRPGFALLTTKRGPAGRRLYSVELMGADALRDVLDVHPENMHIDSAPHKNYEAILTKLKTKK